MKHSKNARPRPKRLLEEASEEVAVMDVLIAAKKIICQKNVPIEETGEEEAVAAEDASTVERMVTSQEIAKNQRDVNFSMC